MAVTVVLALSGWGCGKKEVAAGPAPPVPVAVAKVIQKTVPVEVNAIGNVEAYSTVSIKPRVTGQLVSVHFREGQDVRKDDVLFEIDRKPFDAALAEAEARLARDRAVAANSRAQAKRYAKLLQDGVVAREQADQYITAAEAQDALVRADEAAAETAKLNVQYCTIVSPVDGRTGSLMVHEGNIVKANDVPVLVVINQINPIYVNFSLPEQYLAAVEKYMARGGLRVQVEIPNDAGPAESGRLSFVDNSVDASTGMIRMKATFPNLRRRLWPGRFVNVQLTLTAQPNAILVPSQAIQSGQSGQYVFVVKSDSTVESRSVKVGRSIGSDTVVEKGLQPGETVVTDGQVRLLPGSTVEIRRGQALAPAAPPAAEGSPSAP